LEELVLDAAEEVFFPDTSEITEDICDQANDLLGIPCP
jgi:hypothetical protein